MPDTSVTEPLLRSAVKSLYELIKKANETSPSAADINELAQSLSLISGRMSVIEIEEFGELKIGELRAAYDKIMGDLDAAVALKVDDATVALDTTVGNKVIETLADALVGFSQDIETKINELVDASTQTVGDKVTAAVNLAVESANVAIDDAVTAAESKVAQAATNLIDTATTDAKAEIDSKLVDLATSVRAAIDEKLLDVPDAVSDIIATEVVAKVEPAIQAAVDENITTAVNTAIADINAVAADATAAVETAKAGMSAIANTVGASILYSPEALFLLR